MILVDYNQILLQSVHAGANSFGSTLEPNMIRHLFLNTVFSYEKRFGKKYGDMVICCDGRKGWRKDVFPYYKAKRAEGRAESPLDWEMIFDTLEKLRNELDEYFPWKVVVHDKAEGDDVIAILARYLQTNETIQEGLFETTQPTLIISSDTDFVQLQEFPNVVQYTPLFKKMLINHDPVRYKYEKIVRGDKGDGVPNMFSDDDTFVVDGKRQKSVMSARLEEILEAQINKQPVQYKNEQEKINHDRNRIMIDLVNHSVPDWIVEEILETYRNAKVQPKQKMLTYFITHRMENLRRHLV